MKITLPNLFGNTLVESKVEKRDYITNSIGLGYSLSSTSSPTAIQSMQLSAVYRCVELISDSIASLPFEPIKRLTDGSTEKATEHVTYELLNLAPNRIQTRFTFIKTLIVNVLLNGNGYALIVRDANGNATALRLLPSNEVMTYTNKEKTELYYSHYSVKGNISSDDMIHVLNFSYDGVLGISTLTHAGNITSTARAADLHAKGFFSGGANLSGILKVQSKLDEGQAAEIQSAWRKTLNSDTGSPNGIVVMEGDMDFQPISVSPAEAQMLESRQFSVIDIGRFFSVSPHKLYDTGSNSAGNVEQENLSFLTETLTPLITKIEGEFNRKLFRPSERKTLSVQFNIDDFLRGDLLTQADYYSKLFMIGGYTTNEIRKKVGNKPSAIPNANTPFIQSSMLPVDFDFRRKDTTDNKLKPKQKPVDE